MEKSNLIKNLISILSVEIKDKGTIQDSPICKLPNDLLQVNQQAHSEQQITIYLGYLN